MQAKKNCFIAFIGYLRKVWWIIKEDSGFKTLVNYLNKAWVILKEDTLEIYEKYLKPKKQQPQERKHINFWVYVFIISISSIAMFIYLPLFLGMFNIIFRAASPETTPSVSNESLVSFIILSTALGALILWFTGSSPTKNTSGQGNFITTKGIGKLFLFSALVLSLFLLVNPVLPSIEESTGFYETVIKAMALLSIIGGCFGFTTAILLGLFFIWKL